MNETAPTAPENISLTEEQHLALFGQSLLSKVSMTLQTHGRADFLRGLDDEASVPQIMGRLVELKPGLDHDWTKRDLQMFIELSIVLPEPHAGVLREIVNRFAVDPDSPLRKGALMQLSRVSSAARGQLAAEKQATLAAAKHDTTTQIRGCCDVTP